MSKQHYLASAKLLLMNKGFVPILFWKVYSFLYGGTYLLKGEKMNYKVLKDVKTMAGFILSIILIIFKCS